MGFLIWQLLTCLLVAAIFGLLLGWVFWGWLVRRLRREAVDHHDQMLKLSGLPAKLNDLQAKHSALAAEKDAEADRFLSTKAEWKKDRAAKERELDELRSGVFERDTRYRSELSANDAHALTLTRRLASLEPLAAQTAEAHAKCQDELAIRDGKILQLEERLNQLSINHSALLSAQEEVSAPTGRLHRLESHTVEVEDLESRLHQAVSEREALALQLKALGEPSAGLQDNAAAPLITRISDLEAEVKGHVAAQDAKDHQVAALNEHIALTSANAAASLEAHAAKDTQIQSLLGRVSELEPIAARVPYLESELTTQVEAHAAKDTKIQTLLGRVSELEPMTAQLQEAHASTLSRLTELEPIAARVPYLESELTIQVEAHAAKDTKIQTLLGRVSELEPMAAQLQEAHASTLSRLTELEPIAARVPHLEAELTTQVEAHAAKDSKIQTLLGRVSELEPMTAQLQEAHASTLSRLTELEPVAARVPNLESQLATHAEANAAKDSQIQTLLGRVSELEPMTAQLQEAHASTLSRLTELEPVAARVPHLETELTAQVEAHAAKDSQIQTLLGRVSELEPMTAQLQEAHASTLSRLTELEPIAARVPHLETESTTQVSRISELEPIAARVHQAEAQSTRIADLEEHVHSLEATLLAKESEIAAKNAEVQQLRKKLEAEQESSTSVSTRIHELARELQEAREQRSDAEREIEKLRGDLSARLFHSPEPAKFFTAAAGSSLDAGQSSTTEPAVFPEPSSFRDEAEVLKTPEADPKQLLPLPAKNPEVRLLRGVIHSLFEPLNSAAISQLAFKFGQQRNFQNGSPQEDWLKAECQLHSERLERARQDLEPQGLF